MLQNDSFFNECPLLKIQTKDNTKSRQTLVITPN